MALSRSLSVRRKVMDRQSAPAGVGGLRAPGECRDEVAVIELDFEGDTGEILCGKRERGIGQIDAVIVPDLGAGERRPHLAGIAAGNIEKGEGSRQRGKRAMQDRARFAMRNRVAIDQFLIGRPLLLNSTLESRSDGTLEKMIQSDDPKTLPAIR